MYTEPDPGDETHYEPDFTIPGSDIIQVDISSRTDEIMDDVSITLHNHHDQYTETNPLRQSNRVEFAAPMEDDVAYGDGYYGSGMYGGTYTIFWTGRITDIQAGRDGPKQATLDIEARDYPADILSNRKVTDSYVDEDVGSIIRDICERKAPEIDTSEIPDLGVTTDVKYSSSDCWDAVLDLAARADAITVPVGKKLKIKVIGDLPYMFSVEDRDFYLPLDADSGDDIKNVVRIDSGEHRKLEEAQESVDRWGFKTATTADPVIHRLRARKSQVHSIELYIRKLNEKGSLTVRLQSDEGGEPIAPEDEDSDITSTTWQGEDLPDVGWKTFFFDEHVLADRDPWVIIHGDDEGHGIGHNRDGILAYRSFYPHPLNFEVLDEESIDQYGLREIRIERANLKTLSAVQDAAYSELARRAWPSQTVEFEARSKRSHTLQPGDRITIDRPQDGITGEHIITEVNHTWDSQTVSLSTMLTAEWRKGVLAPVNRD